MAHISRLCALFIAATLLGIAFSPAAAQNMGVQEENAQEDIRERKHLPEGYPAYQVRPNGRVGGIQVPLKNMEEDGAAVAMGRNTWASQQETDPAGSNLMMRADADLTGVMGGSTSIADVDGDGNQDLLITSSTNSRPSATLYLGDGQGGFSEAEAGLTGVGRGSSTSIADVDGDENQDLLITGRTNVRSSATLYLGDGQGGFSEAEAGLTGVGRGSSASIADVDGDGNQDLLITGSYTAILYLGDGQGGFSEANAGLTGVENSSTSIADVDGDGNPDLLITGENENSNRTATLYLGDGQGGFTEAGAGLTGVEFGSTSIADVDGDDNQDLLITGFETTFGPSATLYLGDGQGGFSEAEAFLTPVSYGSTSIADVDGDGNQDLLITGVDASYEPSATLHLGDGQGGFTVAGAGLTGVGRSSSTSIADLQGDGDQDLLIAGRGALFGEGSARIYINRQAQSSPNRVPTFAQAFDYNRPLAPGVSLKRTVEAGDLDGDSLSLTSSASNVSVDDRGNGTAGVVFTPSRSQGGSVVQFSVEASDSKGETTSFSNSIEISPVMATFSGGLTGVSGGSTSAADVDGDGNQDLLITGSDASGNAVNRTATLYLRSALGGLVEAEADLTGVGPGSSTSIADVDGDGNQDLLITGSYTAILYLGDGQGGFSEANAGLTGVEDGSTSIADIDGDGNQDLLITGEDESSNPTATLYLGDGQGGFTEAGAGLNGVQLSSTSITDVDGDGNPDLLITGFDESFNPTATLYLGDGQGGFTEAGAGLTSIGGGSTSIADVNEDGNQDLLITGFDESLNPTATLYLGDGQGEFSEAEAGLTPIGGGSTSIADVDGDGNPDLLITGSDADNSQTATLYLGDGQGGFTEAGAGLTGVEDGSTSIVDIDGDGAKDLLVTGSSVASLSPSATVYENLFDDPLSRDTVPPDAPTSVSATPSSGAVSLSWTESSSADVNRYRIYRSTTQMDPADGPSDRAPLDRTGAGTTAYTDTTAKVGEVYRYRITAVDTAGNESGFSEEATATPEDATPPPVPTGLTAGTEGQQVSLSWGAVASEDLSGYRLYRSAGRSPDTSGAGLTEELISETTFTDTTATENRTYRYGVTAVDTAGNESILSAEASVFRYPSQIQADISRSFGEAAGPGDYRLVALPGEGSRPIADVISGEAGTEWQAYRDDGSEEDFFQKYDGSSDFAFEPGNGFWVTATSDLAFEDSVSTVPLEGDSAATIPLREGWNVISNPTGKAVQWARVRQANPGSLQPLFGFEGTFSQADSLRPATSGRAYYLFNGSADRTELRVPYPGSPSGTEGQTESQLGSRPLAAALSQSEARLISLSALLAGAGGPTSTVRVGVRPEEPARSVVAPPSRFEAVSLRIEAGEAKAGETEAGEAKAGEKNRQNGRSGLLMAQLREGDGDGETFRLRLKGQAGAPVQLEASGVGEAGSVALIRPSAGKTYRLRDGKTVRIESAEGPVSLKLAVGTESYVEGKREEAMPEEVRLTSYPNPTGGQATVEYALPEARKITLEVYDVLGRRVATLAEGRKQAGRHKVSLQANGLPSGAYFGRLEAGGETRTQKITVVR